MTQHPAPEPCLIALDWGTSAQRAWLLGAGGRILDARRSGAGLLSTSAGIDLTDPAARARGHEAAFLTLVGDWLRAHPGLPAIACGMVGSARGWQEAEYRTVPCPLTFGADDLTPVSHREGLLHLVPGLRVAPDPARMIPGDVLRGEETQAIGILAQLPDPDAAQTLVLPGTHSKWLRIHDREVTGFTTAMSGELYALVTEHGILGHTATTPVRDDAAFARGLAASANPAARGLAAELFGARALVLAGALASSALPDYVSGVIIGDEVCRLLPHYREPGRITLCGSADLCRRYATALEYRDIAAEIIGEDVAAQGLWAIACTAGLVGSAQAAGQQS
ncbi:2-dehydro-3-deoxygalactonokinase [Nocardia sp. NPDC020380]|uniref:2-dehydro-3-deoxygalactonokinase n=1 Tax=Nocardia sp. NPDC020380 TaxID=3364309 RepID=UPI0037936651